MHEDKSLQSYIADPSFEFKSSIQREDDDATLVRLIIVADIRTNVDASDTPEVPNFSELSYGDQIRVAAAQLIRSIKEDETPLGEILEWEDQAVAVTVDLNWTLRWAGVDPAAPSSFSSPASLLELSAQPSLDQVENSKTE